MAQQHTQAMLDQVVQVDGVPVLAAQIDAPDADTMREMTDWLRDKLGSSVIVIGSVIDGRPQLVAAVTKDVAERGVHAGNMVREIAKTIGGGGGGSPVMAQAGGKNGEMLPEALQQVRMWVAGKLA
jgi:alanyl-tRNA synthetase